jgi:hypothetical protein
MVERLMYYTALLIIVFYVARNPQAFSSVIGSLGGAYSGAVKALQGR